MKPALVILAAGASRRLGQCKALVELGGQSVLGRLLAAGMACDDAEPLVVTGIHHESIRESIRQAIRGPIGAARRPHAVEVLFNPDWEQGRSSGIVLAHRARPQRDLLICPVDCPLVSESVFTGLVHAWSAARAPVRGWLAPSLLMQGSLRFGHPVVVGRGLLGELAGLSPGTPLRAVRGAADPLWDLPTGDRAILDDLDRPLDLENLRARLAAARRSDGPR